MADHLNPRTDPRVKQLRDYRHRKPYKLHFYGNTPKQLKWAQRVAHKAVRCQWQSRRWLYESDPLVGLHPPRTARHAIWWLLY